MPHNFSLKYAVIGSVLGFVLIVVLFRVLFRTFPESTIKVAIAFAVAVIITGILAAGLYCLQQSWRAMQRSAPTAGPRRAETRRALEALEDIEHAVEELRNEPNVTADVQALLGSPPARMLRALVYLVSTLHSRVSEANARWQKAEERAQRNEELVQQLHGQLFEARKALVENGTRIHELVTALEERHIATIEETVAKFSQVLDTKLGADNPAVADKLKATEAARRSASARLAAAEKRAEEAQKAAHEKIANSIELARDLATLSTPTPPRASGQEESRNTAT